MGKTLRLVKSSKYFILGYTVDRLVITCNVYENVREPTEIEY